MPVAGRKPKEGPKRNRMPAVHDWLEVEDVPFTGKVPVELPKTRTFVTKADVYELPLDSKTATWWKTLSRMPHCMLWTESDWQFALMSAIVADDAFRGVPGAMAELRQREKLLGTTLDARRDLRIRYVEKGSIEPEQPKAAGGRPKKGATVTSIESRRSRLTSGVS